MILFFPLVIALNCWYEGKLWSTIKGLFFRLFSLIIVLTSFCCHFWCLPAWSQDSFTVVTSSWKMILSTQEHSWMLSTLDTAVSVFHNSLTVPDRPMMTIGRDIPMPLLSRKKFQKMRPSAFNNLNDLRVRIVPGGHDEGAEGKLRTRRKLTSHPPNPHSQVGCLCCSSGTPSCPKTTEREKQRINL